MKRISSLWPFLLIALAVLVWNFPLYALAGRIESVSGGKLRVLDAKGSVWNGQLQLGVFDGSQVQAIPNTVQWQLQLGQNKHLAGVSLTT